jgi:phage/plasmid-associated DNA primase
MLISHIQRKIAENNGKFRVSRNHPDVKQAQDIFLNSWLTELEWSKERTLISNNSRDKAGVQELYFDYSSWCKDNGVLKVSNKISFGKALTQHIFKREAVIGKLHNKTQRVYEGVRLNGN